jgi:hypothetical protein
MRFWIPSIGYLKKCSPFVFFSNEILLFYISQFHYLNFEIAKDICLFCVFLYAREIYLLPVDLEVQMLQQTMSFLSPNDGQAQQEEHY